MDSKIAGRLVLLLAIIAVCAHVSGHSPSDMNIVYDPGSGSIFLKITHQVSDSRTHHVNEVAIRKNGDAVDSFLYDSQPTADTFTYTYHLPLQDGDTIAVTARCNIGGSITREYTYLPKAAGPAEAEKETSIWTYSTLWPVHAVLMAAGFVCILASALIPVYGRRLDRWYGLHVRASIAAAVLTFSGLGVSFGMVALAGGPHLRVQHAYLGVVIMIVFIVVLALALLRGYAPPEKKVTIRGMHLWLGRLLAFLMGVNVALGMWTAGMLG